MRSIAHQAGPDIYQRRATSRLYKGRLAIGRELFDRRAIPELRRQGIFEPESRVIEIGCGQGDKLDTLAREINHGSTIEGVDISASMLEEGRRKYPHLKTTQDDARRLDTLEGEYDLILFLKMLQHLTLVEVIAALGKASEHLSPNGKIVILNRILAEEGLEKVFWQWLINLYAKGFGLDSSEYHNLDIAELEAIFRELRLRITARTQVPLLGDLITAERIRE